MARNYTALPHEYRTTMSNLTDAEFGRLIRWLLDYSTTGRPAPLSGREAILCPMVQYREDQFQASFEEMDKVRSESAKKAASARWARKEAATVCESMPTDASACEGMPMDASDANNKTKTKANTKTKTNISPSTDGRDNSAARFVPPTAEEVHAYARERQSPVDPERFRDFYAAKGWMVGKSPMKDWKAAFRNWERDEPPAPVPPSVRSTDEPTEEDRKALQQLLRLRDRAREEAQEV